MLVLLFPGGARGINETFSDIKQSDRVLISWEIACMVLRVYSPFVAPVTDERAAMGKEKGDVSRVVSV